MHFVDVLRERYELSTTWLRRLGYDVITPEFNFRFYLYLLFLFMMKDCFSKDKTYFEIIRKLKYSKGATFREIFSGGHHFVDKS